MLGEIINSIKSNKARSFMTGLGIFWGVLILIILVGIGRGFESGVFKMFNGFAKKTIYVFGGETSVPFKGFPIGRKIEFNSKDVRDIRAVIPEISNISQETTQNMVASKDDKIDRFDVKGVTDSYFQIKLLSVLHGRVINSLDYRNDRKTALIGEDIALNLFNKKNVVGERIVLGGVAFVITGVIKNNLFNSFESRLIYIPYSTFSIYFNKGDKSKLLLLSLNNGANSSEVQKRLQFICGNKFNFNKDDKRAIIFNNLDEQLKAFSSFFNGLRAFLWFMGLSSLFGGVIGVANIMYSVAKERTKEIGIRKAVGAKNKDIRKLFIAEAILLTSIAGYMGLIIGHFVLYFIGYYFKVLNVSEIFESPKIDLKIALAAIIILVTSGTLAGYIPAVYASKLNPVDALRQE